MDDELSMTSAGKAYLDTILSPSLKLDSWNPGLCEEFTDAYLTVRVLALGMDSGLEKMVFPSITSLLRYDEFKKCGSYGDLSSMIYLMVQSEIQYHSIPWQEMNNGSEDKCSDTDRERYFEDIIRTNANDLLDALDVIGQEYKQTLL
jgi:hypothetical protein